MAKSAATARRGRTPSGAGMARRRSSLPATWAAARRSRRSRVRVASSRSSSSAPAAGSASNRSTAPRPLQAANARTSSTVRSAGQVSLSTRGSGAAAPGGALRAINSSARPRSWRTFGPRRLRRPSQACPGCYAGWSGIHKSRDVASSGSRCGSGQATQAVAVEVLQLLERALLNRAARFLRPNRTGPCCEQWGTRRAPKETTHSLQHPDTAWRWPSPRGWRRGAADGAHGGHRHGGATNPH